MMEPSGKISLRHAARNAEPVLFGVGMSRAGGDRDGVAVRPGDECSRAGTRVPPLAVMISAVEHCARHVGVPGTGSMSPHRKSSELSDSSALSVSTLLTMQAAGADAVVFTNTMAAIDDLAAAFGNHFVRTSSSRSDAC